jgi:hypothetical protein
VLLSEESSKVRTLINPKEASMTFRLPVTLTSAALLFALGMAPSQAADSANMKKDGMTMSDKTPAKKPMMKKDGAMKGDANMMDKKEEMPKGDMQTDKMHK